MAKTEFDSASMRLVMAHSELLSTLNGGGRRPEPIRDEYLRKMCISLLESSLPV
ncbi:MAG: hypothetical protein K2Z81_01835 [Cyanobacteria bacterium]|nr:hypothetical protein [Cyanobacteriota bacterium]